MLRREVQNTRGFECCFYDTPAIDEQTGIRQMLHRNGPVQNEPIRQDGEPSEPRQNEPIRRVGILEGRIQVPDDFDITPSG
jgi:hypothetical protein